MAKKRLTAGSPSGFIELRLKENHFVRGKFAAKGSKHVFSKEEAARRMKKTQLWEI